ncbi:unnamed protein product [Rotaria sp. Silwood1]|nr:unnamed protein product [Rotaria sp. Silwood1]
MLNNTNILKKKYTREEIARRIVKDDDLLIIYQNKVYRLNTWIKYHRGGELAILHMIGKDAANEINAYHSDHMLQNKLPLYYFGDIVDEDHDHFHSRIPPIEYYYKQNEFNNHYILIDETPKTSLKISISCFFDCNYFDYSWECIRYLLLAFFAAYVFIGATSSWHHYLSAAFLGALWHQLTFTAHDAGHLAITHSYRIDSFIGIFIGNLLGGISIGWWKHHHNIHHLVTNSSEHDPDIQHFPFFAVAPRFVQSLYSTYHKRILRYTWLASCLIPFQHLTYYLIMCFARYNLQLQSYIYLYKYPSSPYRSIEICCIFILWYCYIILLSYIPTYTQCFIYMLICNTITMPLHVEITLSHFDMSTEDCGPCESFPSKMLRTTMDIAYPTWLDFFSWWSSISSCSSFISTVLTISKVLEYLVKYGKITEGILKNAQIFIRENQTQLPALKTEIENKSIIPILQRFQKIMKEKK